MLISVVNHTDGKLSDEAVQEGIRAVNRQIAEDYNPHWHMGAELRLEGAIGKDPDDDKLPELRGDAIIYLWNEVDVEDALGYHEANAAGIPFGFVFTELVKQLKEPWTVTFSRPRGDQSSAECVNSSLALAPIRMPRLRLLAPKTARSTNSPAAMLTQGEAHVRRRTRPRILTSARHGKPWRCTRSTHYPG